MANCLPLGAFMLLSQCQEAGEPQVVTNNSLDHLEIPTAAEKIKPPPPNTCIPIDDICIIQTDKQLNWPWSSHGICKASQLYVLPYQLYWRIDPHLQFGQVLDSPFLILSLFLLC
uniref:Uncharacterized protein n=1 Tax=Oryza brachyantha TaxID=4533 RepID=J3MGG9_ORYBR